jgi:hypothetical protein
MIGLSLLSSVSKHTMWSYYDSVYFCCRPSVNIICGRIMIGLSLMTDDNNDNPIIIRPHIVFTDGRQRQPNQCRILIGLSLLSSVSKHTMWSYYYSVYFCCRPSVNIICGRIMIGLSLFSSVSKRQRQPNHNKTTYCVY